MSIRSGWNEIVRMKWNYAVEMEMFIAKLKSNGFFAIQHGFRQIFRLVHCYKAPAQCDQSNKLRVITSLSFEYIGRNFDHIFYLQNWFNFNPFTFVPFVWRSVKKCENRSFLCLNNNHNMRLASELTFVSGFNITDSNMPSHKKGVLNALNISFDS